jgi:hypothetical protein
MLEMKVFVATLVGSFVFDRAEGVNVKKFNAVLTRPYVADQFDSGSRLPLRVRRVVP